MSDHGTRYRLVTTQDGNEHISTVVLNLDEARDCLDVEEHLLERSGWQLTHGPSHLYAEKLIGQKRIRRTIAVRAYSPLEDILNNNN